MRLVPQLQRARGRVEVAFSLRQGAVRLDRLYQQGCAKALLPRTHRPVPEVVLVNTAGGVTGGDRIEYALEAGPGAALVVTTQAAERVYRSTGAPARIETCLTLGAGARLDWLPQETILFEAGRLSRRLTVVMAADAELVALETLVLGRSAMGERLETGLLDDQWRLSRAGRLVHAEALRLEGDLARAAAGRATLHGARALATLVRIAPGCEAGIDRLRRLLGSLAHVEAAATARNGVLVVRLLAPDHAPLRAALITVLQMLRAAPLPRVWSL